MKLLKKIMPLATIASVGITAVSFAASCSKLPIEKIEMKGSDNRYTSTSYFVAVNTQYSYTNVKVTKDPFTQQLPTTLSFNSFSTAGIAWTKSFSVKVNGKSATNYQEVEIYNTCTLPTGTKDGDLVEIIATFEAAKLSVTTYISML